ncbi:hypothetical protein M8818_004049 [Zalaria obscura]|uniref:Uncharacterized protein n=1 Tax=Zalaria obscura TaxID=2024903 RepID=A0ACC3SDP7_9PEZI
MIVQLIRSRPVPLSAQLGKAWARTYSSTAPKRAKNRIYNSIRHENELEDLLLLSASSRIPLITLWSASWCSSCQAVKPLIKGLIEQGVGEEQGSVSFAEVEMDSPTLGVLPMRYMISSMPTLLSFDRQEAQVETKLTRVEDMKNRQFLIEWIEREAKRHGQGGGGGGGLFGLFGR